MKINIVTITLLFIVLISCNKNEDSPANQTTEIEKPLNINIKTIAGSTEGDEIGLAMASKFKIPNSICIYGSDLIITDSGNYKLKILINESVVENRGGTGVSGDINGAYNISQFKYPKDIIHLNSNIYIVDNESHKIKKFNTTTGLISTAVGDISGELSYPNGIAFDNEGGLYICDTGHNKIKKAAFANGGGYILQTIAGNIQGDGINFSEPMGIAVDAAKNVYVADSGNYKIKKISVSGEVTTFAGSTKGDIDGIGTNAKFGYIEGITIDAKGNLYVSDPTFHKIKKVTPYGKVITLNSGKGGDVDGNFETAKINFPDGLSVSPDGKTIYFTDKLNNKIKKLTLD
jgi:sugar lactone lactonase YvrE